MNNTVRGAALLALLAGLPGRGWAQLSPATWPVPMQLVREGITLHDQEDYAGAAARYAAVLPGDSTYALAQSELALSLQAAGKAEEAVAAARRALALNPDQPLTYNSLANALADLKQFDAALAASQQGLQRFPHSQALHYIRGVTQLRAGTAHTAGTLASLQRSLELRPTHPYSHRLLGFVAAQQGQPAHALISWLTYLLLAGAGPTSNALLVQAERLAEGAPVVLDNEKTAPIASNTAFAELDQLLESKVALQAGYVSKVKFPAAVVKQTQLLIEKFPVDGPADDFWVRAYGPLVKVLREGGNLTTFTYVILQSAQDQRAAQWGKANKAKVEKLYAALTPPLLTLREAQTVAGGAPGQRQAAWFSDEGVLEGLGAGHQNAAGGYTPTGDWVGVSGLGAVDERGRYSAAGQRVGFWQVLRPDGSVEKTFTYDQQGQREGPARAFHPNGQPALDLTYHLDKTEGPLTIYNECGARTELRTFRAGDLEGPYTTYFPGGQLRYRATLRADKVQGLEEKFYVDGTPEFTYSQVEGKKQGPFSVYYADKTLERKGTYDQDELHGAYADYHANGQVDNTGTYDHGKPTGVWRSYFPNGQLSVERSYDAAGELHGPYHDYDEQGHLFADTEYSHGRTVALRYFDPQGKLVLDEPLKKGRAAVRCLRADGGLNASGSYLDGQMTGEWQWFFRDGRPRDLTSFDLKGNKTGLAESYWQGGGLRLRQHYAADGSGTLEGSYERFHANGKPAQTGYYYQGQRHGVWKEYYATGRLSEEMTYHRGELNGAARSYAPGGQLTQERQLAFGSLRQVTAFDSVGRVIARAELKPDSKALKLLYPSGKLRYETALRCYQNEGPTRWLRPDGTVESSFTQLNDQREGPYLATYPGGQPSLKGLFLDGQRQGDWQYYYPSGQLRAQGRYRAGNEEGEWRFYFPNGQLELTQTYQAGDQHGLSRRYNPAGELLIEKIYDHDDLLRYRGPGPDSAPYTALPPDLSATVRTSFANGRPAAEETYVHNLSTGTATYYYASGQVFRRSRYAAGGLNHGPLESFWPNGKPLEQEAYLHGEHHGRSRYFRPDGTLEREESYLSGERSGPTISYDAKGKLLRTEVYWNSMVYDAK